MRIIGPSVIALFSLVASAEAQQRSAPFSPGSVERVQLALQRSNQQQRLTLSPSPWTEPTVRTFGMFTVVFPGSPGEIIKVSLPIGELTTRAARAVSSARHRRAERKAGEEVQRALRDFNAQ